MSPQPILRDRSFPLNPSKCFQTSYNFQCPKTQCCYGFWQDCPCCPHSRNSMLFSHSLPPRSTTWHWGPFFFTVLAAVGTSKPQNQAATKTVEIKPSFSFISLWCHTCVCVTRYIEGTLSTIATAIITFPKHVAANAISHCIHLLLPWRLH